MFQVKLVLYTGGTAVKELLFDGGGSTYLNWFSSARLREDEYHDWPWTDLQTNSYTQFFSIAG
jgi:hypothetical protein